MSEQEKPMKPRTFKPGIAAQPVPGGNRAQRRAFYAVARSKKPENKKLYAELMHRKNNKKGIE